VHVQSIDGEEIRWQMIARGHWRWGAFDLKREVQGQPSVGLKVDWTPRSYKSKGISWWIYENGRRGPKPCRSLEHAQRIVRGRIEARRV
jgi:hypothetical protein